jgi:hypothetical protein
VPSTLLLVKPPPPSLTRRSTSLTLSEHVPPVPRKEKGKIPKNASCRRVKMKLTRKEEKKK